MFSLRGDRGAVGLLIYKLVNSGRLENCFLTDSVVVESAVVKAAEFKKVVWIP